MSGRLTASVVGGGMGGKLSLAALHASERFELIALADVKPEVNAALAELYAENPEYLQLQIVEANASALGEADKIIFTPEGTAPTIVLPGPGIVPTVETTVETTTP